MPRKKSRLSPETALHLVETLIEEGKLVGHEIARYLKIAELENRLRALRGGEFPVPQLRAKRQGPTAAKRHKGPVSAKRQASQKLQGQYIAYLRQLPKSSRGKFQKMARQDGREKAIVAIKQALAK
jgi:hypothetical protein